MYKNRFLHDAARSAPRNVSTNITPAQRKLPTRVMQMHKIAVLRSPRAATTLPAKLAKLRRAMSAPCVPLRTVSGSERAARSSTMGN